VDDRPPELDLGGVCVLPLLDAEGSFMSFRDAFPSAPSRLEEAARARYPTLFAGEGWTLPFRAFLLRRRAHHLLVDAGVGPPPGAFLPRRQAWLADRLTNVGVRVEAIDLVFFTHLHVDHVGWATTAGARSFPRAHYIAAGDDWRFFAERAESHDVFEEKLAPLAEQGVVELIDPKPTPVAPGVVALPTPGHTPGHMSVRVTGTERELVILGDVAVHPVQLDDPALAYTFDVDASRSAETRAALFAALARERTLAAAGHFPGSGIGYVEAAGAGFAWAPLEENP
jgi:glyoxylase-like metal-dependent hydrolase (beta-lactamase superfamily II)